VASQEKGRLDRERIIRTLTFWLRPEFVLRVLSRFQRLAGFDRSIALASSGLTAIIPISIVVSSIFSRFGGRDTAQRLIDRYNLTGGGAEAVRNVFAPPAGGSTSLGLVGTLFALVAALSFTRAMQRLFEQAWELKPMSVRNTFNGLLWAGGLVLYLGLSGLTQALLGTSALEITATLIDIPLSIVFLTWTGWILSARRIEPRALVPFGCLAAGLVAVYTIGASLYVPHLFSTLSTRYGVIGAVFAMISALFCLMVVLVGSAAGGREIHEELGRIRRGERPAEDEVRRQWEEVTAQARSRWDTLRIQIEKRRRRRAAADVTGDGDQ
jgi:membrane protein